MMLFMPLVMSDFFKDMKVRRICTVHVCMPRVVWSHWGNDTLSEDVEEMIGVTQKSLKNFTFCFIIPSNCSKFVDVSKFPKEYEKLHPAGKCDYIRVCLLQKYAGIYVDSTTYVNSGDEMEWFFFKAMDGKSQITTFPSDNHNYGFSILTSFFSAVEGSYFMRVFKEEWDLAFEIGIQRYCKQTCEKMRVKYYGTYGIVFVIVGKINFSNETVGSMVQMLPANRSSERLIMECGRKRECVRNRLLNDPVARAYPFIKVWHDFRNGKKFHLSEPEYTHRISVLKQTTKKRTGSHVLKK